MLYDPKWDKTNFTAEAFLAWLEVMPKEATYNFHDCDGSCLIDLFVGRATRYAEYVDLNNSKVGGLRLGQIAAKKPHTFGAALERARAALR